MVAVLVHDVVGGVLHPVDDAGALTLVGDGHLRGISARDRDDDARARGHVVEVKFVVIIEHTEHVGGYGDGLHGIVRGAQGSLAGDVAVVGRVGGVEIAAAEHLHLRLEVPARLEAHVLAAETSGLGRHRGHERVADAEHAPVPGNAVAVQGSAEAVADGSDGGRAVGDGHINRAPMVMHIVVDFLIRNVGLSRGRQSQSA